MKTKLSFSSFAVLFALVSCVTFLLAGCGGGNKKSNPSTSSSSGSASLVSGTGRAKLTIKWPAPSTTRLVPDLSKSIVVEILRGDDRQVFDTKVVARPDDVSVPNVVLFESLPVGNLTLRASAHPNPDGSGTAQSASEKSLVIAADAENDFGRLTMDTTIDRVEVVGGTTLSVGGAPQQWTATAKSGTDTVLVSPAKQKWESSAPSVATVSDTGLVRPVGAGTTTIKETDTESGVSGSQEVVVKIPADFTITVSNLPAATKGVQILVYKGAKVRNVFTAFKEVEPFFSGGTFVTRQRVLRTNNEASVAAQFTGLADGTYQIAVYAFANTDDQYDPNGPYDPYYPFDPYNQYDPFYCDASRNAVATQAVEVTTSEGNRTFSLPLVSMVAYIGITPGVSNAEVLHGETTSLGIYASNYEASGVLVDPSEITWASSAPSVASISSATGSSTTVTMLNEGAVSITATHTPSGTAQTNTYKVFGPVKAQFKPTDYALPGGSLTLTDGHTYQFDTGAASAPTLTDTTSGTLTATGQYVTQTVGTKTATYAVFAWAGAVHMGSGTTVSAKGGAPVVLLTQSNFLVDGGAVLDVSALGATPGAGGAVPGSGPGAGKRTTLGDRRPITNYGGGGFGGAGGYTSSVYGTDLANGSTPFLQGGSGGYTTGTTGGASGGALYLAAQGTLTVSGASIKARGGDGAEGGSGGGLVLLGGGGVIFSQATLDAGGGKSGGTQYHGGGGGGRIVVGYGAGNAPDLSLVTTAGGSGTASGGTGKVYSEAFGGF